MIKIEMQRELALLRGQIAALHEMFLQQENVQSAQRAKDLAINLKNKNMPLLFVAIFQQGNRV